MAQLHAGPSADGLALLRMRGTTSLGAYLQLLVNILCPHILCDVG